MIESINEIPVMGRALSGKDQEFVVVSQSGVEGRVFAPNSFAAKELVFPALQKAYSHWQSTPSEWMEFGNTVRIVPSTQFEVGGTLAREKE